MKRRFLLATAVVVTACAAFGEVTAQDTRVTSVGTAEGAKVPEYAKLFDSGATYGQFLDDAIARRKMWLANTEKAQVPSGILARAKEIGGKWHLLAVAVDACSDSANILPYLAALVGEVDALDMRVVHPEEGRWIMDSNPTPDGRAATPTIVLLDSAFRSVGVFIERPRELQSWALENKSKMSSRDFLREKFAWYDADGGRQTIIEVVELMEEAAATRTEH